MASKNISVIGLPATGKSTFIAALWYLMIAKSKYCSLELHSLKEGNQEYLNDLSEKWASFGQLGRTILTKDVGEVAMNLIRKSDSEKILLNIPDYYGEIFDSHFKDREWGEEYAKTAFQADGIIIFIDPTSKNNVSSTLMAEKQLMEQVLGDEGPDTSIVEEQRDPKIFETSNTSEDISKAKLKTYQHHLSSNQVKLVDLLQIMMYTIPNFTTLKLSLVVSAWDVIEENYPNLTPRSFVENKMPLLYQFLNCNSGSFITKYFGISAQGGSYERSIDDLLKTIPEKRVRVYDGQTMSNDIASPIIWLTE